MKATRTQKTIEKHLADLTTIDMEGMQYKDGRRIVLLDITSFRGDVQQIAVPVLVGIQGEYFLPEKTKKFIGEAVYKVTNLEHIYRPARAERHLSGLIKEVEEFLREELKVVPFAVKKEDKEWIAQ